MNHLHDIIAKATVSHIEKCLIESIEKHLGRVPSNDEVSQHCRCIIAGGDKCYMWDDTVLFSLSDEFLLPF